MTAEELYQQELAEVKSLLNQVKGQIERHERYFKNERHKAANFGYCADLTEAKKQLEQLTDFFANSL